MDERSLVEGNAAFRASGAHQGLGMMPRRRLIIIGCADPRVDPEEILGLRMGDAAVIRNIGGRVTVPTVATLAGLGQVGARSAPAASPPDTAPGMDVIVLHHTDCGILRLADDPEALAGFLGTDATHVAAMSVRDPHAAVAQDVAVVRALPMPGLRAWGLVYDVTTGSVDVTVAPGQAAA
jgi:carbonic anhydrase